MCPRTQKPSPKKRVPASCIQRNINQTYFVPVLTAYQTITKTENPSTERRVPLTSCIQIEAKISQQNQYATRDTIVLHLTEHKISKLVNMSLTGIFPCRQPPPETKHQTLNHRWLSGIDGGTTLNQHWFNVL